MMGADRGEVIKNTRSSESRCSTEYRHSIDWACIKLIFNWMPSIDLKTSKTPDKQLEEVA